MSKRSNAEFWAFQAIRHQLRERGERLANYAAKDLRKAGRELLKTHVVYLRKGVIVVAKRRVRH